MAKHALLCPPTYFDVVDSKNLHMSLAEPVDRAKAFRQWEALRHTLKQCGCEVDIIDPVAGLEDMVFAANQAFLGFHKTIGNFAVPSRMVHSSRQREVPYYVEWYRCRGYKIVELDLGDDYLEGHGDLLWHPDGARVYGGYGQRSTRGGVEKFSKKLSKMGIPVVPLHLVDPYFYHLDTCFSPLNNDAALVCQQAFDAGSLAELRKCWRRLHDLTASEAHKFMANCVTINGYYLTPHLTPHLEGVLAEEKLTPVVVDTSEFEKSGGSVFCMKAFLP